MASLGSFSQIFCFLGYFPSSGFLVPVPSSSVTQSCCCCLGVQACPFVPQCLAWCPPGALLGLVAGHAVTAHLHTAGSVSSTHESQDVPGLLSAVCPSLSAWSFLFPLMARFVWSSPFCRKLLALHHWLMLLTNILKNWSFAREMVTSLTWAFGFCPTS